MENTMDENMFCVKIIVPFEILSGKSKKTRIGKSQMHFKSVDNLSLAGGVNQN